MKIRAFILVLLAGGFLLNACQKNIDIFIPDPGQLNGPDTSWAGTVTAAMPVSILKNNLLPEPYQDSIIVNANIASIITPFGIQVNFPANCCTNAAGQPVTGKVQVEILLVKRKGDMIRLDKPSSSNDSMLVTAGEIFINLKKDGQPLQLAPNVRFNVRYIDFPINPQMNFFVGNETNAQHFNWLPNPDTANNKIIAGIQSYEIYTNRLRWISAAYLYEPNNTVKVNVSVVMASYFTNANTVAFTAFKDLPSVVSMQGNAGARKFISGKLPVGKQITVVVISKQGNDYYLGHQQTTTQAAIPGSTNQSVHIEPIKKSFPEILAYLNSL